MLLKGCRVSFPKLSDRYRRKIQDDCFEYHGFETSYSRVSLSMTHRANYDIISKFPLAASGTRGTGVTSRRVARCGIGAFQPRRNTSVTVVSGCNPRAVTSGRAHAGKPLNVLRKQAHPYCTVICSLPSWATNNQRNHAVVPFHREIGA